MKTLIPTQVIHEIERYIKIDVAFSNITPKQHQRLVKELVSLWYFIYSEQQNRTEKNLHKWLRIHNDDFRTYRYKLRGIDYGYAKLLRMLSYVKLIKINENHLAGQYTFSYKIETKFISKGNMTEFEIDFKQIFKNTRDRDFWCKKYPSHISLIDDIFNTTVDLDGYLFWLQQNEGMYLKSKIIKGVLTSKYLTKEVIFHSFNAVLRLNFKNIWVKISNEGRFYNTISNLPSTVVSPKEGSSTADPFLRIGGQHTKEIDIKNSQPLLLSVLLSKNQQQYTKDVVEGIFYQKVADKMGIKRNDFKALSYKYIFFNKKPLKSGRNYNAIESVYPGLMAEINAIKENTKLAHKLQEMEAEIFVNNIGKLNFPKLLRHDQVIVTQDNYELTKQALRLEYLKLGIKVNLEEKNK